MTLLSRSLHTPFLLRFDDILLVSGTIASNCACVKFAGATVASSADDTPSSDTDMLSSEPADVEQSLDDELAVPQNSPKEEPAHFLT